LDALEARVDAMRSSRKPAPIPSRRLALGFAWAWLLAAACGGGSPPPAPLPDVHSTAPTERLPIDGLWEVTATGAQVQLERGRMYLQSGFGPDERHGILLYADIHQTTADRYRCRKPLQRDGRITWIACTMELAADRSLRVGLREPDAPASPPSGPGREGTDAGPPAETARETASDAEFTPVVLADETWFRAQAGSWHIISLRDAHRPPRAATRVEDSAAVPELPPSPAPTEPALEVRGDRTRFGRYVALVIGSADYTYLPDVATAAGDSAAVSRVLERRYGFEVTHLRNPSLTALTGALGRYERELGPNDNFLLYWAGHGYVSAELGRCYWFPVDAVGEDPAQGLASNDVAAALDRMQAKHAIVVADSCFTSAQRREAGLRDPAADTPIELSRRRTRVVLTSGGLEPLQDGRGSGHSVFTGALLSVLSKNRDVVEGAALYEQIREQIVAGASQTPEYADVQDARHAGGDFVFVPNP
jgi:hypothetical protein